MISLQDRCAVGPKITGRLNSMCLSEFAVSYDIPDSNGEDTVLVDDVNYINDNGLAKKIITGIR